MKAVILVGGEATRLRPLTCNIPKGMVPVLNIPFLEWMVGHLKRHGVTEIIMSLGFLAQPIQDYFKDGSQQGVLIRYVQEKEPLGTAGGIRNAAPYIDDTFLALNGDIIHDFNITRLVESHRKNKAKATIAIIPVEDPSRYGLIETDADSRITRFLEKPKPEDITTDKINAGIYVLEPGVFEVIPPQTRVSIERETFPQLLAAGERVFAYPENVYWIDAGAPEAYLQLHRDLLAGRTRLYSPAGTGLQRGIDCDIAPTAEIIGSVIIGNKCHIGKNVKIKGPAVLGAGCIVEEDCIIEDSILWQNVYLGPQSIVYSSIIANGCQLEKKNTLRQSVLGDNVIIPARCIPAAGTKVWPDQTYQPHQ